MELPADTIIEILHRLPTKSLLRFKCVSTNWAGHIFDCCSRRLCTRTIGFFYQAIRKRAPIHFLLSPKETAIENFDESVNFLPDSLYIIASSKGYLLCCKQEINHRHYYVYNPATRQYLALLETQMCVKDVAIGFNCKVYDPIDVISFTIVRYMVPGRRQGLQSTVTIESFSTETNVWTKIILTLDNHIRFRPLHDNISKWLTSAGAIDGVFYWFHGGHQITAYDTMDMCFWSLELPDTYGNAYGRHLGVSGEILCYAVTDLNTGHINIWHMSSNIRDKTTLWVRKYIELDVIEVVNTCPETLGLLHPRSIYIANMDFHPTESHIIYLNISGKFISYDMDNSSTELVCDFRRSTTFNFFPYEWQEWPRSL
ncbi:F-box protein At1g52495-like [Lycium ferocissimum]|uniref:F-box protein At1g52495-like n=1 Tax=Lycium ferocissimum TaxID=112874 RepID=UPI0028166FFA|nr:F-box protein At1g52495-like [Lycium ferocissimum]